MVEFEGVLYVNLTGNHDNTLTPDDDKANWKEHGKYPPWLPGDTYAAGDRVTGPNGDEYEAVQGSTGVDPDGDLNNTFWVSLDQNEKRVPIWSQSFSYDPDDLVAWAGVIYRNTTGANGTSNPAVDDINWEPMTANWAYTKVLSTAAIDQYIEYGVDITNAKSYALWINGVMIAKDNWGIVNSALGGIRVNGPTFVGDIVHLEGSSDETVWRSVSSGTPTFNIADAADVDFTATRTGGVVEVGDILQYTANGDWVPGKTAGLSTYTLTSDFIADFRAGNIADNTLVHVENDRATWLVNNALNTGFALVNNSEYVAIVEREDQLTEFPAAIYSADSKIYVTNSHARLLDPVIFKNDRQNNWVNVATVGDAVQLAFVHQGDDWVTDDAAVSATVGTVAAVTFSQDGPNQMTSATTTNLTAADITLATNANNAQLTDGTAAMSDEIGITVTAGPGINAPQELLTSTNRANSPGPTDTIRINFTIPVFLDSIQFDTGSNANNYYGNVSIQCYDDGDDEIGTAINSTGVFRTADTSAVGDDLYMDGNHTFQQSGVASVLITGINPVGTAAIQNLAINAAPWTFYKNEIWVKNENNRWFRLAENTYN